MSEQSTPDKSSDLLIDADAAAALLSVSPAHVRRLSDAGQVPGHVRFGRCRRWVKAVLLEWIAEGCPNR